ncbi:unnamed protein product [Rhizoctonia solani]|uniref:Uncharacterized protein n=1 Tax=Rhizoctonia solani TaxID=456999 RepID=A0A8H3AW64_9AGAM|nr:unnamed protein product [Rhizoctonia solani]
MLDPLVDDLLRLKQGVRMIVRQGDPPTYKEEVVYGKLSQHISDLIARIKMGGAIKPLGLRGIYASRI